MSFFSKIGGFIHTVTGIADKVLNFVKAPIDAITKPLTGLVDKLADKLPFGLGNVVKPFVDKFMGTAVAWLAGGPLGGLFAMITKIEPTVETVDNVLHAVDGALNAGGTPGGVKGLPPPARDNVQNIFAYAHAQALAA